MMIQCTQRAFSAYIPAAAFLLGLCLSGTALAQATGAKQTAKTPNGDATVSVTRISEEEQREALAYWTPERMAETMRLAGENPDADDGGHAAMPHGVATPAGQVDPVGGTDMMTMGRLFIVKDGVNGYCSGNFVQSYTRSVVATAGHCVQIPANAKPPHPKITRLVFLAHYRKGEWSGRFVVRNIFTVQGWELRGEKGFDFAFLSLGLNDYNHKIGDLVAPYPVKFAASPLQGNFVAYGYPNSIAGGELPQKCSGFAKEDAFVEPGPKLRIIKDGCLNFDGGASGGPVTQTLPDGTHQTGNIVSYFSRTADVSFTYWETAAHGAWDRAQHDE